MRVVGVDHVQLAMPRGKEPDAVRFYTEVLGIPQVPKPPTLAARGGCWFESADVKLHLGVDNDFRASTKAHVALVVDDVRGLAGALVEAGFSVFEDEPLDCYDRIYTYDPFGNRVELMERCD